MLGKWRNVTFFTYEVTFFTSFKIQKSETKTPMFFVCFTVLCCPYNVGEVETYVSFVRVSSTDIGKSVRFFFSSIEGDTGVNSPLGYTATYNRIGRWQTNKKKPVGQPRITPPISSVPQLFACVLRGDMHLFFSSAV